MACNLQNGVLDQMLDILVKGIVTYRTPSYVKIVEQDEIGSLKDLIGGNPASFRDWIDNNDTTKLAIQSSSDLSSTVDQVLN